MTVTCRQLLASVPPGCLCPAGQLSRGVGRTQPAPPEVRQHWQMVWFFLGLSHGATSQLSLVKPVTVMLLDMVWAWGGFASR